MVYLVIILTVLVLYLLFIIHDLKSKLSDLSLPSSVSSPFSKGKEVKVVYSWKLDSARNVKLKGHLELIFNTEEIRQQREANPYMLSNPYMDNVANLRKMYYYMLSHPKHITHVADIVKYINRECSRNGVGELDKLQFVLDFVQEPNIKYIHDYDCDEINRTVQYIRYPDETLFDRHGDCDCKSFLAASLFHVMGYNVLFMLSHKLEHAAICVEYDQRWRNFIQGKDCPSDVLTEIGGRKYVFCETTSDGFRIGGIGKNQSVEDFDTVLELRS